MNVTLVAGRKRSKGKGKNNGKRAIKKKHSQKVAVKKKCLEFAAADIEPAKVELHTIKEECTDSQILQVECQSISAIDRETKRKRIKLEQDSTVVLECKFQPDQMVSLCTDWQSLFNEDFKTQHTCMEMESKALTTYYLYSISKKTIDIST